MALCPLIGLCDESKLKSVPSISISPDIKSRFTYFKGSREDVYILSDESGTPVNLPFSRGDFAGARRDELVP